MMFLFEIAKKWASGKLNKAFSKVSVSLVLKKSFKFLHHPGMTLWSGVGVETQILLQVTKGCEILMSVCPT